MERKRSERKTRKAAQGVSKVKTGCQTCKYVLERETWENVLVLTSTRIRHKKCDELRPECTPCRTTSRLCDFLHQSTMSDSKRVGMQFQNSTALPSHSLSALGLSCHLIGVGGREASYFEFFRFVSAPEIGLFFENEAWIHMALTKALIEPSIYHAALATAVLSRMSYHPQIPWFGTPDALCGAEYANLHYNLAIRALNRRIDASKEGMELAVIGCVFFAQIEFLDSGDVGLTHSRIAMHLRSGFAILGQIEHGASPLLRDALNCLQQQFSFI